MITKTTTHKNLELKRVENLRIIDIVEPIKKGSNIHKEISQFYIDDLNENILALRALMNK